MTTVQSEKENTENKLAKVSENLKKVRSLLGVVVVSLEHETFGLNFVFTG